MNPDPHDPSERVSRSSTGNEPLVAAITAFCQRAGMAESTFGRHVVNDGKLVSRLRGGGRVTTHTVEKIRRYIENAVAALDEVERRSPITDPAHRIDLAAAAGLVAPFNTDQSHFRFYDNRQKYLLFVNTCNEKSMVAQRIDAELELIRPSVPALRVFDAGVGDGTVLTRVMRSMHDRFPNVPFYIVGKEISVEDVRLALDKMADRFLEHPATVLVMTNMLYSEAPWLRPDAPAQDLSWHELALSGHTSKQFERQIASLQGFLDRSWTATNRSAGSASYDRPIVLVIYRDDHRLLLDPIRPQPGAARADYDLVIASQPYRSRTSADFKAQKVIAPLVRALGPGGRLIGIHARGQDPALEIVQRIWPGEAPFFTDRHELLKATKKALGPQARQYKFNAYSDKRSLFRYEMHTLPSEIGSAIGTSTLLAAWNAAVYVAQIEDQRLEPVMNSGAYLDATREVLQRHGKLWFQNESYVISRSRFGR